MSGELAVAEPISPVTIDGAPPRLADICGLCHTHPTKPVYGHPEYRKCVHCDEPCPIGEDGGCAACQNVRVA